MCIRDSDQAVGAVAQAETAAQGKLSIEAGREEWQRHVGQAEFVDRQLCLGQAGARRQTKLGEDLLAGDASVVVSEAVYQDGYAKACLLYTSRCV